MTPDAGDRRLHWLDGLRGVGAVIVLLSHTISSFLPGVGRAAFGTPLNILFDGSSAVFVFFLLSGVAMSYSFAGDWRGLPAAITRRFIRLGLPMASALALGAAFLSVMPSIHIATAQLVGSGGTLGTFPVIVPTLQMLARQIAIEGMFVGADGNSLLPGGRVDWFPLTSFTGLLDPPLWTLHIEWIGSMLVLLLTTASAAVGRRTSLAVAIIAGLSVGNSLLLLFVVGHVASPWLRRPVRRPWLGAAMLAAGVLVCSAGVLKPIAITLRYLPDPPLGLPLRADELQKIVGAVLLFTGVALSPSVSALLSSRVARWLGRLSFSIYLIHFPVLLTVSCAVFSAAASRMPSWTAGLLACATEFAVTVLMAAIFARLVDRPAIRLSRRITRCGNSDVAIVFGAWTRC